MRKSILAALAALTLAGWASSAEALPSFTTAHGPDSTSLDGSIASGDLISGLIGTELAGDLGWHPANTSPADQLPALTDDAGKLSGLTGLLSDFPPAGAPAKRVHYDLAGPTDIAEIRILSGTDGKDGRVFSTTVISTSVDGSAFTTLGYFQSDPSGTVNSGQWGSTLVTIFDRGGPLATGVTNLIFDLYAVDDTMGVIRDPFDGMNPFTGTDDGLTASFVAPLIFELDVIAVPEPGTGVLLALGLALVTAARRPRAAS